MSFYPFNKADKILVISFDDRSLGDKMPVQDDSLVYSKIKEVKVLDKQQTDSLTDILFNIGYRGLINVLYEPACFQPRNGLVFLDRNNQVLEYVAICFECEDIALSSEKIMLGEFCTQKYAYLRRYFLSLGIRTGTLDPSKK